jgi:hypothetical protein
VKRWDGRNQAHYVGLRLACFRVNPTYLRFVYVLDDGRRLPGEVVP